MPKSQSNRSGVWTPPPAPPRGNCVSAERGADREAPPPGDSVARGEGLGRGPAPGYNRPMLTRIAAPLARYDWLLLLLLLPAVLFPSPALALTWLALPLLLVARRLAGGPGGRFLPPTAVNTSLLLLALMILGQHLGHARSRFQPWQGHQPYPQPAALLRRGRRRAARRPAAPRRRRRAAAGSAWALPASRCSARNGRRNCPCLAA